jgi:hypothetical protein
LKLRGGAELRGIKGEETAETLAVFDVSMVPPIKRTILKADIIDTTAVKDSGIYDHTKLPFTKQDWLDLSAYLGKPPAAAHH